MTEKYSKVACFASTSVSELNIYQMGKGDHDTLTALVAEFDIMDELLLLKDFDPEWQTRLKVETDWVLA